MRLSNIRTVHFSRNPKIARFLQEYDYVKKFGEGVDRMFKEMSDAGLSAPEYTDNAFMLNATIRNGAINENSGAINGAINEAIKLSPTQKAVLEAIIETPSITKQALCDMTSLGKEDLSSESDQTKPDIGKL